MSNAKRVRCLEWSKLSARSRADCVWVWITQQKLVLKQAQWICERVCDLYLERTRSSDATLTASWLRRCSFQVSALVLHPLFVTGISLISLYDHITNDRDLELVGWVTRALETSVVTIFFSEKLLMVLILSQSTPRILFPAVLKTIIFDLYKQRHLVQEKVDSSYFAFRKEEKCK